MRLERAGFDTYAVADALILSHYDFVQSNDLASWKGYYIYRNLFAVHLRYGTNLPEERMDASTNFPQLPTFTSHLLCSVGS